MPLKRSRPNTETKFKDAVLELVAESGCEALGVNAVAHKAGADKVLIYRYFGDLNGLLMNVADQQVWLPTIDELADTILSTYKDVALCLRQLFERIVQHIRSKSATHQIMRWRKAAPNPLTNHFSQAWHTLWNELPARITSDLDEASQTAWRHACALIALLIEAELNEDPVDLNCIQVLASDLPALKVDA